MDRLPRTLLEQLIQDSDHTIEEWCARFDRVARDSDVKATLSARQLQRWMAGAVDSARPSSRRVAARLWGCSFADLMASPSVVAAQAPDQVAGMPSPIFTGEVDPSDVAAALVAHESMAHAVSVGGSVDGVTIEQVQAEAWRIARSYTALPPLAALAESKRARDLVYLLLEQTRRPQQTMDLYLVAGQLCGLMAAASFDLAAWDASIEQSRAAYIYGELIDHHGLRAWTRGHQALIAYWIGNAHQAVALAEAGIAEAPAGTPRARLYGIAARAWSHVGNAERVRAAISAADTERDNPTGRDELHDDIAGEFGWGASRHAACMGSALVQIGDGPAAARRIETALRLLPTDPNGGLLAERAYCDLANAELTRNDLDGATRALAPVWELPVSRRSEGVTGRLLKAERMLVGRRWRHNKHAATIRERIVMFNAQASARALPAPASQLGLPGGQ